MITRWNPFNNRPLSYHGFDQMVGHPFDRLLDFAALSNFQKNDNGSLSVSIDVPGIKETDITIENDGESISVKGESKTSTSHRSVSQTFSIPEGYSAENVKAELSHGILTLTLESKQLEPQKEVKKIPITST